MDPAMKTADISVPLRGVRGFAKNQSSYPVRSRLMYDQEQDNCTMGLQWESGFLETAVRISRLPMIYLFIMIMSLLQPITAAFTPQHPPGTHILRTNAPNASTPLLECLQVSPPVLSPDSCQKTLMVHTFGFSYGIPFVAEYTPPACDFNRVTINFTVTSAGRQFDRLGHAWFNDTEIFRTSTAEPTQNGIIWTYTKDMSSYLSLFKEPQKLIFDLGNLVDDTYTGSWQTTLTANFFTAEDVNPADVIVPVSTRNSGSDQPSQFVVPGVQAAAALTLPQNIKKAVFTIAASGQAAEEFWWANVLSTDTTVFGNDATLYGYSPFRELQLYIDGTLAGVAWPFPIIFTGGIVPGFWRPIVGIDAFDLLEDEIDITPFLPVLCDGKEHTFEIKVVGIDNDGNGSGKLTSPVGSNWVISGKVFIWLDAAGSITRGTAPTISAPDPTLAALSNVDHVNGTVKTLDYSVTAARQFSLSSHVETSEGSKTVTWSQDLHFWLNGQLSNGGNDQSTTQSTTGNATSSDGYSRSYDYPLWVISSYNVLPDTNFTIDARMGRGKYVQQLGSLAFPSSDQTFDIASYPTSLSFIGSQTNNWQNGTAHYLGAPALKKSFGSGSTEQLFTLDGIVDLAASGVDLYRRHIVAINDSVTYDQEIVGDNVQVNQAPLSSVSSGQDRSYSKMSIKAMLGRGPF
ncbi:hypothetical protein DM02DRAFT_203899 [Periconia macrospinosa]|uniref:Peptide N-acetyl-beta-D-glucosaminyl asparaginase amidase A N-terminal domain-containing protein n=1 Tax=Periconia macrospinosa TaxID=97972 RepID=A0A2V1D7U8_9PLEO|nr:hypothetical protein DM02DRAFT_203899 [Periconia macrospinosa]